jgi:uncharacterized protein
VTLLVPQSGDIPLPRPTLTSEPFWEGCAQGELRFQRCRHCGAAVHTPAVLCWACWETDLDWEVSSGRGAVYSWTLVWRPQTPAFVVPYAPVIVDLEEGWQMLSCLIDCESNEVAVGMPVAVAFRPVGEGLALPYFRPDPSSPPG